MRKKIKKNVDSLYEYEDDNHNYVGGVNKKTTFVFSHD